MGGTWKAMVDGKVQEGLSLARLESLVCSRRLTASDRVCSDGEWLRVEDIPFLNRHCRRREASPPEKPQVESDSLPFENSVAAWNAILLATSDRPRLERIKNIAHGISIIGGIALVGELLMMAILLSGHRP